MDINQTQNKQSIKDFFLNIGSQVALYAVLISLGNLIFKIINKAYPSVDSEYYYYSNNFGISFPVSLIIVVFPVFILLQYLLERGYETDPTQKNSTIKRLLTYLTIFVSGTIFVVDLISVLYMYIDGRDLAVGFLLKILVVLTLSAFVFVYYINDIKEKISIKTKKISVVLGGVVVLISIILAFSVIGSPRTQRLMRYDDQKVNDLSNIDSQIINYYSINKTLPDGIEKLNTSNFYYTIPVDPQSKEDYKYKKVDLTTYELCAEFNFDFDEKKIKKYGNGGGIVSTVEMLDKSSISMGYPYYNHANFSEYTNGEHCFKRTVPEY